MIEHSTGTHRVEWWKTVIKHCCNIHDHDSVEVPHCKHGPLDDVRVEADGTVCRRVWLNPWKSMRKLCCSWEIKLMDIDR